MAAKETVSLRVHIAPVGFEVVRVTEPLRLLHADRVVLLTPSEQDDAREYLLKIRAVLDDRRIPHATLSCDTWDTATVVGEVGALRRAAPVNDYFFNVSSGPKPAGIAGSIAGMMWGIRPYYIAVDYKGGDVFLKGDYPIKGEPKIIATFGVEVLEEDAIRALAFLVSQPQPVPKWKLRRHLETLRVVRPKRPKKEDGTTSPQAFQAQVNLLLHKLVNRGFITIEGKGAEFKIAVTEKGVDGHKMYRHMIEPLRALPILQP